MTYAELDLTLRATGEGGTTANLRFRAPGSAGYSALASDVPVSFDHTSLIELADDWDAYGRSLTGQLFASAQMREAWREVRGFLQGARARLRLRLWIDPDAADLHALRWELLCEPVDGWSLCRSERVLFSRNLDTASLSPLAQPDRAALRALVAGANPRDLGRYQLAAVDVAGELGRARAALGDLPTTPLAGATLEGLLDSLRAGYPLLSLVCHGSMVDGKPFLWLERADGGSDQVAGEALVQQIADLEPAHKPLLIILAACQTAGRDQHAAVLATLGPQLVARAGVGAVIGMQGNVPSAMIELLLPRLLKELRASGQIDQALALSRQALAAEQPWWMPALFMRVRDGRLWAGEAVEPAHRGSAPGFARIATQLLYPQVRERMAEFRALFRAERDQIDLLNRYKELHDALQVLEKPFNVVATNRRRLADDPATWDELYTQIDDLQACAHAVLAIMATPHLADRFVFGMQQLQMAIDEHTLAMAQIDTRQLTNALKRYKRVLDNELSQADKLLAVCASELRLEQVIQALRDVQAHLTQATPDRAGPREFATLISSLDEIQSKLADLVPAHHRWQAVDGELRRVAESLSDLDELRFAWADLLRITRPFFGADTASWAQQLNGLSAQIDQALADGASGPARRLFISYQSLATRRFVDVDKALLATCNELRTVGQILDTILRTLDE